MKPAANDSHQDPPGNGGGNGGIDLHLLEIAGAVADGDNLDWPALESSSSSDDDRALVRAMWAVAEIGAANRQIQAGQVESPAGQVEESDPATPPDQSVPRRWGPLEIIEKIGEGAFGEVYRARDTRLAVDVALKLQRPGSCSSSSPETTIIEEGRLLARVRHENVASVFGAECHDDRVGIWMEFIPGRTLEDLVATQGTFGPEEAMSIGRHLCRALAAIHQAGVLHRDIKTRNVMRRQGGRIVLMDLGTGSDIPTETGQGPANTAGTPLYMAPETLLRHEASVQSDIYSLGVLLYYLVTGAYPVTGQTVRDLRQAHAHGQMECLLDQRAELPESFIRVVERALAADPGERYSSAGQFEQALADALGPAPAAESADATAPSPAAPAQSWWRRSLRVLMQRRLPALAGLAAAIALALIISELLPISSYSVEAALYRRLDETAGRSDELLLPGANLELGDRLYLAIEGSRELFVYVISEDDAADSYLLFPNASYTQQNPLPAGRRSYLPGPSRESGQPLSWTVTSTGGREHIMVLASPHRLTELEEELGRLPQPQQLGFQTRQYTQLPESALIQFRGIGGLVESPPTGQTVDTRPRQLADLVQRFEPGQETIRSDKVWMRQIELNYPPQ